MSETPSAESSARAGFHSALAEIHAYQPERQQFPAFMTAVDQIKGRGLPALVDLTEAEAPALVTSVLGAMTASEAIRRMAAGSLTAVQAMEMALAAIDARQPALNAFVYVAGRDELLAQAAVLDAERAAGMLRGPLHGLIISVKDVIAVDGMPNTASSAVLADEVAGYDATSVRLLKAAGAIIIGKAQTHEFALGVVTQQSSNPWDVTRNPGGSSGGSAISVVTGMAHLTLGTDTRASSRVPSSLCGGVALKATFGLVPADGVTTLSWSLDHVAPMGATVEDTALMLSVLTQESTGVDYTAFVRKNVAGLRVAVPLAACEDVAEDVLAAFWAGVERLRAQGVAVDTIDAVTAEDFELSMLMGLVVSRCEAATYHLAFRDRLDKYLPVVAAQLEEAGKITAVDYLKAQRWREAFRSRMLALLAGYDGLLMPTTAVAAPKTAEVDDYFLILSRNCIPWSFIGFPASSVPCGWTREGLPVGAQFVTGPLEEGRLVALSAALERTLPPRTVTVAEGA